MVDFGLQDIAAAQQSRFDVIYKGVSVGEYIPDLVVFDRVIVDTKTNDHIGDHEMRQMLNYLKISGLPVGLNINFKHAKLTWRRVINSNKS